MCLCVAFSAGRDSFQASVLEELDAFHADSLAWLEAIFAQAARDKSIRYTGDAPAEARACLTQVEGVQLLARASRNPRRYDEATALLQQRITVTQ